MSDCDAIDNAIVPPYRCIFCGAPSWVDPSDQHPPSAYCHESDHGSPDLYLD